MVLVTPADGMLIVPVPVIGPPVRPAPVATSSRSSQTWAELVSVIVPPKGTLPPPDNPAPA